MLFDFAEVDEPDERAAFSVILFSHASISASSETGETVIAGDIAAGEATSVPCGFSVARDGDFTFFDFFEVRD